MEAISIIGFLVFIFTLFYLAYHFIRKIKQPERKLSKKVFYPILIGAFLFFIIGALFTDTGGSDREKLDETLAANESLSNEIIELNKNSKELQLDYDKLESDTSELSDEVIGLEDDIKELKDKYKKATEENETLEEEIETLTKTNKELQEKLSEKEASAKDAGSSKSKSTSEPKDTDKDTSTGSSTSESIDDNVSTSSDEEKDCDIKGSQNGIYHVPGSTYYSRTTNVEQWFCSTDEAEQAGYRAPER